MDFYWKENNVELFKRKKEGRGGEAAVQLRDGGTHPFRDLTAYTPLAGTQVRLYRAIREAVPLIDAAVCKLIRLTLGVGAECADKQAERELSEFLRTVNAGRGQMGINAFLESYLDSMLVCGRGVGEIVPSGDGRDIAALLCAKVEQVEIKEGASPLEFALCSAQDLKPLPHQELLLFTPMHPEADNPYGVSLLRSMPFLSELLMKIYYAMGQNWERCGNVRFAVTYKPQGEDPDRVTARERATQIAEEWSEAMQQSRNGSVRDFVSVGDVSIRTIGADCTIPESEASVRQILEQLVAKTGLPPFMLGINWSATERMSSQQADLLTTEITAIRRSLTPVLERICRLWLRMHGYGCRFAVVWDDINLQDIVEEARAELYREQARRLKIENDAAQR